MAPDTDRLDIRVAQLADGTDDKKVSGPAGYRGTIISDPADVRDLIYRPSLGLLPERFLCTVLDQKWTNFGSLLRVRNQESQPSCIGEALAAIVDIQRIESYRHLGDQRGAEAHVKPASAAMLHAMALEIESIEFGQPASEIYSLRSGLKGFYNSGVCSEATWATRPLQANGATFDSVSVDATKEARSVTLGAYYRVRSFINDFHAALVEAGALYVSADLHGGWGKPEGGVIGSCPDKPGSGDPSGGHAFAIVGYDRDGFLVLNSWGEGWGGYAFEKGRPLAGIALWPYADWAANVTDAWVLRLAAPMPDSFRFAVGQHGATMFGADQSPLAAPSVRRLEVLGHYIHMEDGRHVGTGSYPSSRQCLETTVDYLRTPEKAAIKHIRLTFHGDTMPVKEVMGRLARSIPADKSKGVFGISFLWVNGLLSGAADALKPLFDSAFAIANGNRDDANDRIERLTQPVGRALWRDVKRAADVASTHRPLGDATHALRAILTLCRETDKRLHIVTEGAGVLLLAAMIGNGKTRSNDDTALSDALASLTLVSPLIPEDRFNATIGRFLETWRAAKGRQATIFRPDEHFDERLCVGPYSRSWTDLISRAFEETPTRLVGAHDFATDLGGDPAGEKLTAPKHPSGDLSSSAVLQHEHIAKHLDQTLKN